MRPLTDESLIVSFLVFITWGGTELGKVMAQKFSKLGANVVIAAKRLPDETALEIQKTSGNKVNILLLSLIHI